MMPFTRWMAKTYLETEFQLSTAKEAVIAGEKNGGLGFIILQTVLSLVSMSL